MQGSPIAGWLLFSDARNAPFPLHDLLCRVIGHGLIADMRVWLPGKAVSARLKKNTQISPDRPIHLISACYGINFLL